VRARFRARERQRAHPGQPRALEEAAEVVARHVLRVEGGDRGQAEQGFTLGDQPVGRRERLVREAAAEVEEAVAAAERPLPAGQPRRPRLFVLLLDLMATLLDLLSPDVRPPPGVGVDAGVLAL